MKTWRTKGEFGIQQYFLFLRSSQTVQISKNVKILDSPGIVMANPISKNNTILCLKNLVRTDKLNDPLQAAQAILVRATKEQVN